MYTLILTKEQAEVVSQALDLFSRIGCGQLEEVLRHPTMIKKLYKHIDSDEYVTRRTDAERGIAVAKKALTGYDLYSSEGITVADEPNRIAFDIMQVIRHRLAWDRTLQGGVTVDFHEPMKWSDQPLPTIKKE